MENEPDFFLCARGESRALSEPRACWARARLQDDIRDDYMLVEIQPPLIGQKYGLGGDDINQLVLATRHAGRSLYPISEWPSYVYVFRILDYSLITQSTFTANQVEMLTWGMIF